MATEKEVSEWLNSLKENEEKTIETEKLIEKVIVIIYKEGKQENEMPYINKLLLGFCLGTITALILLRLGVV